MCCLSNGGDYLRKYCSSRGSGCLTEREREGWGGGGDRERQRQKQREKQRRDRHTDRQAGRQVGRQRHRDGECPEAFPSRGCVVVVVVI